MIEEIKIKGNICFIHIVNTVYSLGVKRTKKGKRIKQIICFDVLEHPDKLNFYIEKMTKEN